MLQHIKYGYCSRRGGKICTSIHFKPLWSKNVPRFGLAHCTRTPKRARASPMARDTHSSHMIRIPRI